MVRRKKNQRNMWVDEEFLSWLKQLKAKKQLSGSETKNFADLTKEIMNTDAIKEVERQLLGNLDKIGDVRVKIDKRRLFG